MMISRYGLTGALVAMLAIAGCSADAQPTGSSEPAAAAAPPLHSTYELEGAIFELTGQPLESGSIQVKMHLSTQTLDKSVSFDPQTAGDELVPELRSLFAEMSPKMMAAVREAVAASPPPGTAAEARWSWLQSSMFMVGGGSAAGAPHDQCTSIPGGYWDYCPNDRLFHCCVFSHKSICDWLCSWQ